MTDLDLARALVQLCSQASPPAGAQWLQGALARLAGPASATSRADFLGLFSAAGRKLGQRPLQLSSGALAEPGPTLLGLRGLDEVARVALLLCEVARSTDTQGLVNDLYLRGAEREKQAVLRALPLLPAPEQFTALAVEACRSSVQPIFEAVACDSPFPARYFTEQAFNQLVLKALFTGTSVQRIAGLAGRVTPELVRMAQSYGEERRAAGRPVPLDLEQIVSLAPAGASDGSQA